MLWPTDGDAALPVVEGAHHQLAVLRLWETGLPKIMRQVWSKAAGVQIL